MTIVGIWPGLPKTILLVLQFGLILYCLIFIKVDLIVYTSLEHFLQAISELAGLTPLFIIFLTLWFHQTPLGAFLKEARNDFDGKIHRNEEEKNVIIKYNEQSKIFPIFDIINNYLYFFKPILHQILGC